jgi:hypothetical protein
VALTPQKPPAKILRVLGPKDQPTWERALVGIYDYLDALTSMAFQQSVINNTPVIVTGGGPTGPAIASLGAPGADGADGEEGSLGPPGATGKTGIQGVAGLPGTVGAPGTDGEDGDEGAPGVPGLTGPRGPTGTAGSAGPPGTDGEGESDSFYPTAPWLAWPAAGQVVYSNGTGPMGNFSFTFDDVNHVLTLASADTNTISLNLTRGGDQSIQKAGSGTFWIGTLGAQSLKLYTNNVGRLIIDSSGNVQLAHYGAGALLTDASGNVTANAFPTAGQVLVSSGTTTAPVGDSLFTFNAAADEQLVIGPTAFQAWYNATGANYERVRAFWSGNVWTLVSEKGGAGTVRQLAIDAGTADATVAGGRIFLSTTGQIGIQGGSVNIGLATQFTNYTAAQMVTLYQPAVASAAGATLDAVYWGLGAAISGSTNITTASGFNAFTIPSPSYTGNGFAITNAATFTVKDAPSTSGSMTITNKYAVWVQAGGTRLDGNVGFCGAQPAARQTVTGSRGGNAALASLISGLATQGLIADSTTP